MSRTLGRASAAVVALVAVSLSPGAAGAQQVLFADVASPFPGQGCGGQGCWTNHMRLTDLDGDGDLDVIFPNTSGFFSNPGAQPLEIWRNGGAGDFSLATTALLGAPVSDAIRVVAVGDVDGDGRKDIVAPSAAGASDRLWIQDAGGAFAEEGAARLGTSSRSAAVRLGDVDGDGDLDLVIAQGYAASDAPPARLHLNDGGGVFSEAQGALPATAAGNDPDDVDFFDADGDFDLDLLVNFHEGPNALWLNDGSGRFEDASSALAPPEDDRFHYGPTACDIDGDGDRDLLIDNIGPGVTEQVLINDGAGSFTAESFRLGGNEAHDDNGVVCLDFDHDGDFDVIVPSLSSGGERLFENDGTGVFQRVTGAFTALTDPTLWLEAGDVDGDGRLDVVTAQGEGSPEAERLYLGTAGVAVDTSPPVIFAWDVESFWPEIRFAVRDGATSDEGPRVVNVEAQLPNAESPVPATPMGSDLFRVLVPEEATELSLCATDPAGNVGCLELTPGGTGGGGPGSGGGGTESGPASGSVVSSSGADVTTGGAVVSGGGTGGDGGGPGDGDDVIIDRGCGCVVAGASITPALSGSNLGGLGLVLAAALARRVRRRERT